MSMDEKHARKTKSDLDQPLASPQEFAKVAKRWVDWYTAMKGFHIQVYNPKNQHETLTPKQLIKVLKSNPTSGKGLCFFRADNKTYLDMPGPEFLDDLLEGDKFKYPDTEVIMAVTVPPNAKIRRKIIGVCVIHRYDNRVYEADENSKEKSPVFQSRGSKSVLSTDRWMDIAVLCVDEEWRRKGVGRAILSTVVARAGIKKFSSDSKTHFTKRGKPRKERKTINGILVTISNYEGQWSHSERLFGSGRFKNIDAFNQETKDPWLVVGETETSKYMLLQPTTARPTFWNKRQLKQMMGQPRAAFCPRGKVKNWLALPKGCKPGLQFLHYPGKPGKLRYPKEQEPVPTKLKSRSEAASESELELESGSETESESEPENDGDSDVEPDDDDS